MRLLGLLIAVTVLLPAPAGAKPRAVLAPPGDSAVSQYVEDVPTDSGATPTPHLGTAQSGALTSGQGRSLDRLGPDGRLLLAVVEATSPPTVGASPAGRNEITAGSGRGSKAVGGTEPGGAGTDGAVTDGAVTDGRTGGRAADSTLAGVLTGADARSPASLILGAAGGSGGLGILLPAIMLAIALAAFRWALRRRRAGA